MRRRSPAPWPTHIEQLLEHLRQRRPSYAIVRLSRLRSAAGAAAAQRLALTSSILAGQLGIEAGALDAALGGQPIPPAAAERLQGWLAA